MDDFKNYDFNALLSVPSEWHMTGFMIDMWGAAVRVCPKWRGHWPGGNALIEWLYNERPEIARAIERKHHLYLENDEGVPLSYNHDFGN
jgi:hypothetical protein